VSSFDLSTPCLNAIYNLIFSANLGKRVGPKRNYPLTKKKKNLFVFFVCVCSKLKPGNGSRLKQ